MAEIRFGRPTTIAVGKLHFETFGSFHRFGRVWLPNSLHIWWGRRGWHIWPGRITRDTLPLEKTQSPQEDR